MQFVAEVHDTELSSEISPEGAGFAGRSTAHFPPVQLLGERGQGKRWAVVPAVPTATQSFTAVQDTLQRR